MNDNEIVSEYAKGRLLGYAQLLSQIADDYMGEQNAAGEQASRAALLNERQERMTRIVLGNFVMDTAGQLEKLANTHCAHSMAAQRQKTKIIKGLKAEGIVVHDYYRTENRNGYEEIGMVVSSSTDDYYDVSDIAFLLSRVLHKDMLPMADSRRYVHREKAALCFQEEVRYQLIGGYAKATKEAEEVSGDSFLLREFGDGTYIAAIADGMGSGEEACESSEKVLELLERYLEAGLSVQDFRKACNGLVYIRRDLERSVTVDILECNQYTAEGTFYKNGSCSSFLVRGEQIKEIGPDKLALGIKMYTGGSRETVFFESGDRIVMLSDGVMDFYTQRKGLLQEILIHRTGISPNELAAEILKNVIIGYQGKMPDDMTVLTVYVTENM